MKNIKWYKCSPWIPIAGLWLTHYYHKNHGDTGIEINWISWVTACIQGLSILSLATIVYFVFK